MNTADKQQLVIDTNKETWFTDVILGWRQANKDHFFDSINFKIMLLAALDG